MSNGFGINFLRFINEEGANGWCQVFARLPFDEVELLQKGALFGVVFGKNKENWGDKEAELTDWLEEFFNKQEGIINLANFFEEYRKKFVDLQAGWIWISKQTEREIRMLATEGIKLTVKRDGQKIALGEKIVEKVMVGKVKDKDIYYLGTQEMGDDEENWEEEVGEKTIARCGLKIEFEPQAVEQVMEEVIQAQETIREPIKEDKKEEVLASEKYVGKIGWKEKFRNWFGRSWIVDLACRQAGRRKGEGVMVVGVENKKKRWSMFLGAVFLVVLIISLVLGSMKMKKDERLKQWRAFQEPIEKRLNESLGLAGMNDVGAKKIVEETRQTFNQGKAVFETGEYKKEVGELDKRIAEVWTKVSGEKTGKIEELLNLELIRSGVDANRLSWIEKSKITILGQVSGLVMSGDTANKEVKVVAGKGVGLGWIEAVSDGTKTFILTKGGVSVVGKESQPLNFDAAVLDPIAMARFGNNIYILEKTNKEIFKYTVSENGFGDRVRWLKEGQVIKSTPVDMAIDVDIWVLGEGNTIERFRRGMREEFVAVGLGDKTKLDRIAVDQNNDKVALLGISDGVIVVCSKQSGVCNEQIINERLKQSRDIEFDGQGQLLVLFAGSVGMVN